jgi:hypothetical protein
MSLPCEECGSELGAKIYVRLVTVETQQTDVVNFNVQQRRLCRTCGTAFVESAA